MDLTKDEKEETFKVLQEILFSTDKVIEVNTYGLNLPCLVGVLLGFPLVYNFSEQVVNPLGNLDLVVMRITCARPRMRYLNVGTRHIGRISFKTCISSMS